MKYKVRLREIITHEFEIEAESYKQAFRSCGEEHLKDLHLTPVTNITYSIESIQRCVTGYK